MIKKKIRNFLRNKIRVEIKKFNLVNSEFARLQYFFHQNNIDLVLDVGASTGGYGCLLRELGFTGRIVSFEPLSDSYSKLKKLSELDSLWEVAPRTAIGNMNGDIKINIASNSSSSSVLNMLDSHVNAAPGSKYYESEIVQVTKLDTIAPDYFQSSQSILLKIDVQGYEKPVLEGAEKILEKIKAIQVELSLLPLYQDQILWIEMIQYLENLGYQLYNFRPVLIDSSGKLLQVDGLFIKEFQELNE
ncbi:FkbM family methyltransferase [Oscillatoria sp. HE19RPO]|uniref:FkbM family methyltransferase n=1 Tax=Oscillatoria sp. HE19RPO TaxID=2954806 RepID=UPI0020C29F3D|nr:FkbM family methyltransferase [Oscillatoria sp. HE19RPO]